MTPIANMVSCVMITGKHAERAVLAKAAVESFLQQTWQSKELVIINDGQYNVLTPDQDAAGNIRGVPVKEIHVKRRSLGELRNLGLSFARGQWVAQWDDDDWSHPDRLVRQLKLASPSVAVLLSSQLRYSFASDCAIDFTWKYLKSCPGIPGTVLHHNSPGLSYPDQAVSEDEVFLRSNFPGWRTVVLDNAADSHLYLRFYHGRNTWDEGHIMGRAKPGTWSIRSAVSRDYLQQVLYSHYSNLMPSRLTPRSYSDKNCDELPA